MKIGTSKSESKVEIEIIDNGKGISSDDEDKTLEPFFTPKKIGELVGAMKEKLVLIVDDEETLCDFFKEQLKLDALIKCDTAYSGLEALTKIKDRKGRTPQILATIGLSEHSAQEVIEGAIGVYEKPQDMNDLISTIKEICK